MMRRPPGQDRAVDEARRVGPGKAAQAEPALVVGQAVQGRRRGPVILGGAAIPATQRQAEEAVEVARVAVWAQGVAWAQVDREPDLVREDQAEGRGWVVAA